jgi:iron complex transport system substrate-binding protein
MSRSRATVSAVKKPEHQWETRRFVAVRRAEAPAGDGAQAFELRARDGGAAASAVFGRSRQQVDAAAFDEDLVFAAKAWLAARGARTLHLVDEAGATLATEAFTVASLSDPPPGPAGRIVTLCPSNAEVVGALGCFDRVVACEDSSDWPPEVTACERLGPDLGPDLERVAALEPELVLSSLSVPGMERNVTGLRVRGVRQRVLAPRSLAEVEAEVAVVGADLGVADAAAAVVRRLTDERAALRSARPATPVRVYLEWWPRPMFSPGADCYSNELISLAGGVNVFADRPGASVEVTAEDLLRADPQVCFVSWCGVAEDRLDPDNLIRRAGLERLRAAKLGRVFRLDERFSGRPGPRMLEASRIMARAIAGLRG